MSLFVRFQKEYYLFVILVACLELEFSIKITIFAFSL